MNETAWGDVVSVCIFLCSLQTCAGVKTDCMASMENQCFPARVVVVSWPAVAEGGHCCLATSILNLCCWFEYSHFRSSWLHLKSKQKLEKGQFTASFPGHEQERLDFSLEFLGE